jgi:hypothetical protein
MVPLCFACDANSRSFARVRSPYRVCERWKISFVCVRKVDGRYQYDQQVVKLGQQWVVSGNLYATRVLMFGLAALATPAGAIACTSAVLNPGRPHGRHVRLHGCTPDSMHPKYTANH